MVSSRSVSFSPAKRFQFITKRGIRLPHGKLNANDILINKLNNQISNVKSTSSNKIEHELITKRCMRELLLINVILSCENNAKKAYDCGKNYINQYSGLFSFANDTEKEAYLKSLILLFVRQPWSINRGITRTGAKYIAVLVKIIDAMEQFNPDFFTDFDKSSKISTGTSKIAYKNLTSTLEIAPFAYIKNVRVEYKPQTTDQNKQLFSLNIQLGRTNGTMGSKYKLNPIENIQRRPKTLLEEQGVEIRGIIEGTLAPSIHYKLQSRVSLPNSKQSPSQTKLTPARSINLASKLKNLKINNEYQLRMRRASLITLRNELEKEIILDTLDLSDCDLKLNELCFLFTTCRCAIKHLVLKNNKDLEKLPEELLKLIRGKNKSQINRLESINIKGTKVKTSRFNIVGQLRNKKVNIINNTTIAPTPIKKSGHPQQNNLYDRSKVNNSLNKPQIITTKSGNNIASAFP